MDYDAVTNCITGIVGQKYFHRHLIKNGPFKRLGKILHLFNNLQFDSPSLTVCGLVMRCHPFFHCQVMH